MAQVTLTQASTRSAMIQRVTLALFSGSALLASLTNEASLLTVMIFALVAAFFTLRCLSTQCERQAEELDSPRASWLAIWSVNLAIASFFLWLLTNRGAPLVALIAIGLGIAALIVIHRKRAILRGFAAARLGLMIGVTHLLLNFILLPKDPEQFSFAVT